MTILHNFCRPQIWCGNVFGHIRVSASAYRVQALISDLETSFLVCGYIFRISRTSSYIKVTGKRSRSQQQKVRWV